MSCTLGFRDISKHVLIVLAIWYAVSPDFARPQLTIHSQLDELSAAQRQAVNDYIGKNERPVGELRIMAQRGQIVVRSSKVLGEVFPQYRFVVFPWCYQVAPEAKDRYQIPGELFDILALDANAKSQYVFYSSGNQEQFGDFLKARQVNIRTDEDAARFAAALTDIYAKGSRSTNLHHNPTEWYLAYQEFPFRAISGEEEIREAYYFHLRTDGSGRVLGGRLESEVLERRRIQ